MPRLRFSPGEKIHRYPLYRRLGGTRAGLDTEARGKILSPLPGMKPRSSGRPARSQTRSYNLNKSCNFLLSKSELPQHFTVSLQHAKSGLRSLLGIRFEPSTRVLRHSAQGLRSSVSNGKYHLYRLGNWTVVCWLESGI
jgi:hypothetical protein